MRKKTISLDNDPNKYMGKTIINNLKVPTKTIIDKRSQIIPNNHIGRGTCEDLADHFRDLFPELELVYIIDKEGNIVHVYLESTDCTPPDEAIVVDPSAGQFPLDNELHKKMQLGFYDSKAKYFAKGHTGHKLKTVDKEHEFTIIKNPSDEELKRLVTG